MAIEVAQSNDNAQASGFLSRNVSTNVVLPLPESPSTKIIFIFYPNQFSSFKLHSITSPIRSLKDFLGSHPSFRIFSPHKA